MFSEFWVDGWVDGLIVTMEINLNDHVLIDKFKSSLLLVENIVFYRDVFEI